jgi:hypothetical protein
MAMRRREQQRGQENLLIVHTGLPRTVAHPFYEQQGRGFDAYVEQQCARFYACIQPCSVVGGTSVAGTSTPTEDVRNVHYSEGYPLLSHMAIW